MSTEARTAKDTEGELVMTEIRLDATAKRIRVRLGRRTVGDSTAARLANATGRHPE